MKILFLSANPKDNINLAIDEEVRAIERKISMSTGRYNMLEMVTAWAVRPDDLLQHLNQHRPEIVHFSGHGSPDGISLVDDNGLSKSVSTKSLVALFTNFKSHVKVVVLNSCYSESQAKAMNSVVDYVVGMSNPISDLAAIIFSASFYRAIAFERPVTEAFEQARTALLLENINEEWTPVLLVREGIEAYSNNLFQHYPISHDVEKIKQFRKVFDRPAFVVPCVIELWMEELATAIDDVQTAINTGRLYSRDGKFLGEVPDKFSFETPQYQDILSKIASLLIRLKLLISNSIKSFKRKYPSYYDRGPYSFTALMSFYSISKWLVRNNDKNQIREIIFAMDKIDKTRNEILSNLNILLAIADEEPINAIELSSEIICKGDTWNGVGVTSFMGREFAELAKYLED